MKPPVISLILAAALTAVLACPLQADPLADEVLKFYQVPLNGGLTPWPPGAVVTNVFAPFPGHDELSTAYWNPSGGFYQGTYMADDFCDYRSTPIVHVMWWGSYMSNYYNQVQQFLIAFEADVPANDPGNPLGYSHPGSNIVSQIVTLGPLSRRSGTFTEMPVTLGTFGPPNPDGNLYQYNAELAIPVTEQSNRVMWVKIVALTPNPMVKWGWHNRDYAIRDPLACTAPGVVPGEALIAPSMWHFQDDAVTGPVMITFVDRSTNVIQTAYMRTFYQPPYDGTSFPSNTVSKDLAFALYTESQCPPPPTNSPTKWIQTPDLQYGMNVLATYPKILADDFLCTTNGPITDVHIYGSWLFDEVGIITNFHISFHADVPAGIDQPYSHPGQELWSTNFAYGHFTQTFYTNSNEYFFDPNINQIIGGDSMVFRYDFLIDAAKAFVQTNGHIYWMDVQAYTLNGMFGWKSAATHCYDDGVWGDTPQPFWKELRYPPGHPLANQSFDLAFELTTGTTNCIPPPTLPTKWIQYPDLTNGMNVLDSLPLILGDDFKCTLTGPITDMHIWGSWLNDIIGQVQTFNVSIYSDVPAGGTGTFSHPGNLLWTTNYFLGQYTWQFWTNSNEYFFNPEQNGMVGNDTQVFRYNFCVDPAKAFIQTNGVTYWLVVQALQVIPAGATFGWKSAPTHCYDDGVWANVFTPLLTWQELRYPPGHPLYGQSFDLAFEITTPVPWDTWRLWYFGSTNCALCGGDADFDGDGAINTNEYLSGTVPTNSASFFRVTSIVRSGANTNDISLTWTTVGGHSYLVQTNAPPPGGHYTNNFSDLSAPIQFLGTGESTLTYTDSAGATNNPTRFYRVKLGPPVCQ